MSGTNCFGFQGSGGSGGGKTGYIDIEYNTLYNTIIAGALVPGQKYRLIDYVSNNYLNGLRIAVNNPTPVDPSFNPQEVYTSNEEVLLLEAITPSAISPIAYSENHPEDIVEYSAITNSFGLPGQLSITNGSTLPDSSVVSGFDLQWDGAYVYFDMPSGYPALLGQSFYLSASFDGGNYYIDAEYNPLQLGSCFPTYSYSTVSTPIQWAIDGTRIILLNLSEGNYLNYVPNSLYVQTLLPATDKVMPRGQITRRIDTIQNVDTPFDFRNQLFRRYEMNTLLGLYYMGIGDVWTIAGQTYTTTGKYQDTPVFQNSATNVVWTGYGDNCVFNNISNANISIATDNTVIGEFADNQVQRFTNSASFTLVGSEMFYVNDCLIEQFNQNSIMQMSSNILSGSIQGNVFLGASYYNNLVDFQFNQVGSGFANNIIFGGCSNNVFGNYVTTNNIKTFFAQNNVGNYFSQNQIEDNCSLNNFGDAFNNNIGIKPGFIRNTICANFGFTDFSTASFVYADFDCQIIKMQDGVSTIFWLAYTKYNGGAPLLQYAAPNA